MPGQPTSVGETSAAAPSGLTSLSIAAGPKEGEPRSNVVVVPNPPAAANVVIVPNPTAVDSQTVASGDQINNDNGLANIKEKTPMCLVNELARFNKITHQYKLVDETGPAHKKTFSVVLKLGDEEYAASGASIKKAQHAAAEIALRDTKYKNPTSRNRNRLPFLSASTTPTVELNSLAMKLGESVVYSPLEHPPTSANGLGSHPQASLPPPPHHLHPHQFGPGLSSTYSGHPNGPYPPSPHHHHHHHHHPHHMHPPHGRFPPPSPIGRNFIPPSMPPYPRGGGGGGVNASGSASAFHHPQSAYDFRGMCNQRYHHPPHHLPPHPHFPTYTPNSRHHLGKLFYVSLKVGSREFVGQGVTRQLARHQAATKAILCLRQLTPEAVDAAADAEPDVGKTSSTAQSLPKERDVGAASSPSSQPSTMQWQDPASGGFSSSLTPSSSGQEATSSKVPLGGIPATNPQSAVNCTSSSLPHWSTTPFVRLSETLSAKEESFIDPVLRSMQDLTIDAEEGGKEGGEGESADLKSEISLVHEITLKRNLVVDFQVTDESGPPHMRVYVTQCTVSAPAQGDGHKSLGGGVLEENQLLFKTEAEGNGKKVSKKKAATAMLKLLRGLPAPPHMHIDEPLPTRRFGGGGSKMTSTKKKRQNLIKVQKGNADYGQGINPISRLIQIQQAKREKEPSFSLLTERGLPRRREFVMQVTVNENQCTGTGPNKKLAKRAAAEVMLQLMGYSKPSPQPDKPAIRTPGTTPTAETANKKVSFTLSEAAAERGLIDGAGQLYRKSRRGGSATLQQLPGVIFMPEGSAVAAGIFNSNECKAKQSCEGKSSIEGGHKTLRLHIPTQEIATAKIESASQIQATKQAADSTSDAPAENVVANSSVGSAVDGCSVSNAASQMSGLTSFSASPSPYSCQAYSATLAVGQAQAYPAPSAAGQAQAYSTSSAAAPTQPQTYHTHHIPSHSHFTAGVVNVQHATQALPGGFASSGPSRASTGSTAGSVAVLSRSTPEGAAPIQSSVRPKQQLLYLGEVLGFHVNFTDFPKKGHGQEYLSLVSLSTNPPQVSHGSGLTLEASQNAASLHALKCLAELGLESVSAGVAAGAVGVGSVGLGSVSVGNVGVGSVGAGVSNSLGNNNIGFGVHSESTVVSGSNMMQSQVNTGSNIMQSSSSSFANSFPGSLEDIHSQPNRLGCQSHEMNNHLNYQQLKEPQITAHAGSAQRLQHHLHAT